MTSAFDPLNSRPIEACQLCAGKRLRSVLFLGFVPPVNTMPRVGRTANPEIRFPLELLRCDDCSLMQIGYEVDQRILFPHEYPYLSGTTRVLRDNFRDLAEQCRNLELFRAGDRVIDIGANDGTLLQPFKELGAEVLGIEPSQAADVAQARGISMVKGYFSRTTAESVSSGHGRARIVTAANVFAHIADVHDVVEGIKLLLEPSGVFISENHYFLDLVRTNQYDTIYHEHLRYYTIGSLRTLLRQHGLEIFRVKRIPTHGGSVRVFAAEEGRIPVDQSVTDILSEEEEAGLTDGTALTSYRERVVRSKLDLLKLVAQVKSSGNRIFGIGAPSRASTLITYVGLDDAMLDCIVEVKGSHKLDKYMPGTRIPVLDEEGLYREQPEFALLLSWHIGDELIHNLRKRGYGGKFIVPLPEPHIA